MALIGAIVLEGGARKWLLPPVLHPMAFAAKDVLAFAFILRFPMPVRQGPPAWLRDLALVTATALFLPAIAGLLGTAQSAIVTYKNAVLWPLFASHLIGRLDDSCFSRLIGLLAPMSAAMAILGWIQYRSPDSAWINRTAWNAMGFHFDAALFGESGGTRASGTFSFINGMALFSIFVFQFSLWRLLQPPLRSGRNRGRERLYAALGIVAGVACGLESGSRSTVVSFALTVLLTFLMSAGARRRITVLLRLGPVAGLGIALLAYVFPDVATSFTSRWNTAGDKVLDRMTGTHLRADYLQLLADHPLGVGLGQKTGYGVAVGQAELGAQYESGFDDGGSNAVLEGGVLGLLALGFTGIVSVRLLVRGLFARNHRFRLACTCLGALALYFVASGRWYDHLGTALLWLSISIWLSTDPGIVSEYGYAPVTPERSDSVGRGRDCA